MLTRLRELRWPETRLRRFLFAMAIYFPAGTVVTLIIGAIRRLPLGAILSEMLPWILLMLTAVSVGQALLAKAGTSFWKPLGVDD